MSFQGQLYVDDIFRPIYFIKITKVPLLDHLRQGHACQGTRGAILLQELRWFLRNTWFLGGFLCNSFINFQTSVNIVRLVSQDFLKHVWSTTRLSASLHLTERCPPNWLYLSGCCVTVEYGPTERACNLSSTMWWSLIIHDTNWHTVIE